MKIRRVAIALAGVLLLSGDGIAADVIADRYTEDQLAPVSAYLATSEEEEVSIALSAAPAHISESSTVLVMTKEGYATAREGSNGFVCLVERSWAGSVDYIGAFWDPRIRAPICYNQHAAKFVLPLYILRTELALAGKKRAQIAAAIDAAVSSGKMKAPTGTAMSYMMSARQHLHPDIGRWLPHLMIWMPYTEQDDWGANVLAGVDPVVFRNPGGPFAMVVIPYGEARFIEP
ncbi:MAG: hypothetical protein OER22_11650 [Gammaproteobacteria bacterium]|nr:hypothetical protein [Gammaproteobacteria bacterium]